jgi:hypothetical protein
MSVIGEAPVLNEVDDTSSLKTERNPGHRRPLLSQPAQSEADRVSGLSRSDLVLWLQAVVRRIAPYVGFTSSSGHSDMAFDVYGLGFAAVRNFEAASIVRTPYEQGEFMAFHQGVRIRAEQENE